MLLPRFPSLHLLSRSLSPRSFFLSPSLHHARSLLLVRLRVVPELLSRQNYVCEKLSSAQLRLTTRAVHTHTSNTSTYAPCGLLRAIRLVRNQCQTNHELLASIYASLRAGTTKRESHVVCELSAQASFGVSPGLQVAKASWTLRRLLLPRLPSSPRPPRPPSPPPERRKQPGAKMSTKEKRR